MCGGHRQARMPATDHHVGTSVAPSSSSAQGSATAQSLGKARVADSVQAVPVPPVSRLDALDMTQRLTRDEETSRLEVAQRRLLHLRLLLGGQIGDGRLGPPVCVVFEGLDASGKGGA